MGKLYNDLREIFNKTLNGGVVVVGNTCAVVGDNNNKVKEYIRADQYPVPYTSDWAQLGSDAYLDIPEESEVEYAVLEWHSTVANYIIEGTTGRQYNPVNFTTPKEKLSVSIEPGSSDEAIFSDGPKNKQSTKWVDVTESVKKAGSGKYSIKGIPTASIINRYNQLCDHEQAPGWSLTVVYSHSSLPSRSIKIFMGLKQHTYNTTKEFNTLDISELTITDPKKAYLTMVASNGDPNMYARINAYPEVISIDSNDLIYAIGNSKDASSEDPREGDIIPYDNLFSGIIMNTNTESENYGEIDKLGTFGDKNNSVFDILNQPKFKGNRGKMDILTFDISDKLISNQTNLYLRMDLTKIPAARIQMIVYATQIDI